MDLMQNVPEWPIETTGKLCSIAHEGDAVSVAVLHEGQLDGANAAVHHVTGCNTVCTSLGIRQSDFSNARGGSFSINGGHVGVTRVVELGENATVPM